MGIRNIPAFVGTLLLCLIHGSDGEFLRVCYYQSWAVYRTIPQAYFDVFAIDPYLCTHLVYAFCDVNTTTKQLIAADWNEDGPTGKYSKFTSLKKINPSLKTLLSIGGQHSNSEGFISISSSEEVANNFSLGAVSFLRSRGFDGLDVDWEYPNATTKGNLNILLKSLRSAFNADPISPKLLLTLAGAAGKWFIDPGFDVPEIAKYLDFVNLMTYDYLSAGINLTAFSSPLYSSQNPIFDPTLSTNWSVQYWHELGMPYDKIVVGATGVGRRVVLQNLTNVSPGSKTTGEIRTGRYYQIPGGLAYPEICEMLQNSSTRRVFDDQQMSPYLVNGDDWVGYEDRESLKVKIAWMKNLGVAGFMLWALDYDDFSGKMCQQGKYPLLSLVMSETTNVTTPAPTTTPTPTPTPPPTNDFLRVCYFPNWANGRGGISRFDVADIDPFVCTHLIYAFGTLDAANKQLTALNLDQVSRFTALKQTNPSLKTLLSVGGQNADSSSFLAMAGNYEILQNFSRAVVKFLRDNNLDGLDIDWEYPDSSARILFIRILQFLRQAFDAAGDGPRLLLTFAAPAGQWNIDPGYDVAEIAKYVDYANLMTYDYTDKGAKVAAFNSPLYSRNDPRFNSMLSTNWTVHYWNDLGMPLNKILVGTTGVGRRLVLQDRSNYQPGSNVTGEVRKGADYMIEAGLAYPEICRLLQNLSTTRYFDQEQKNPYLVNGDDWVGYEDRESLAFKIKWMTDLGVAGFMFWSIDQDDFSGNMCQEGRYPLLNFVKNQTTPSNASTISVSSSTEMWTSSASTTTYTTPPSTVTTTSTSPMTPTSSSSSAPPTPTSLVPTTSTLPPSSATTATTPNSNRTAVTYNTATSPTTASPYLTASPVPTTPSSPTSTTEATSSRMTSPETKPATDQPTIRPPLIMSTKAPVSGSSLSLYLANLSLTLFIIISYLTHLFNIH